jgi:two-component system chemotaxis response regulator CheY
LASGVESWLVKEDRMKALVVDDSRATRMILRRMLSGMGFEDVIEAEHGADALQQLEAHGNPDLVLCDWNMPEMDGLTFVKTLRDTPAYERLKVVMVTSESSPRQVYEALKAGADEFAMKPITREIIEDKLGILGLDHAGW